MASGNVDNRGSAITRPAKFKTKRKRNPAKEALARLKARWEKEHEDEEWEGGSEPVISPMFQAVEGGTERVIEALRAHDDNDARSFIDLYSGLSATDRRHLPLEAIAFASGVGSLRLAEVAQTALYLYASMQTKMLISTSMVKVTKAIVKAATDEVPITAYNSETGMQEVVGRTNGDVKAMVLFSEMAGTKPVPKGAQIAIQNNYGEKDEQPTHGPSWRSSEEMLREFQDATEPKRLPSPQSEPISIGGAIDRIQEEILAEV